METSYQTILDELRKASNEELDEFASLLQVSLSSSAKEESKIKKLDNVFRMKGGHTIANVVTRLFDGPSYREIVCDVADYYKIPKEGVSVPELENIIVCKVIRETLLEWRLSGIIDLFNCLGLDHDLPLHDAMIENKLPNAINKTPTQLFGCATKEVLRIYKAKHSVNFLGSPNSTVTIPGILFVAMLRHKN